MNLLATAVFCWCLAIGLVSQNWLPLMVATGLGFAAIFWLRLAPSRLRALGLLLGCALPLLLLRAALGITVDGQADTGGFAFIDALRAQAIATATGVNLDSVALTLGLAIGDSSLASQSLLQDMKAVSLTHLVAVSGANCAIVVAACYFALRRFSIRFRVLVSLFVLLAYVVLVGGSPSVIRAAVMAAAVLLAQLSGRKSSASNVLSLSVICILIADPRLALSYSFALSVSATAGILLLAQIWQDVFENDLDDICHSPWR